MAVLSGRRGGGGGGDMLLLLLLVFAFMLLLVLALSSSAADSLRLPVSHTEGAVASLNHMSHARIAMSVQDREYRE